MSRKWPDPSLGYEGLRDLVVTREVHCTLSITMNLEKPVHLYVTEELCAKISHPLNRQCPVASVLSRLAKRSSHAKTTETVSTERIGKTIHGMENGSI
jgi:hypothetical protein